MLVTLKHWNPAAIPGTCTSLNFSLTFASLYEQHIKVMKFIELITGKNNVGRIE